eukprot:CAMPEP_0183525392 /NCGR_PEP_ID=MMETSP0371-20130417/20616_1 /TAXON_ID=268820 /ORGANISM="Peridinium aciculiferum, Strain PAER-2" /LENGTH=48 /DNA_ID= /DNA_START= /DNA_END= /DNA_ORIENTATION=
MSVPRLLRVWRIQEAPAKVQYSRAARKQLHVDHPSLLQSAAAAAAAAA